jgi:hypothetical protein
MSVTHLSTFFLGQHCSAPSPYLGGNSTPERVEGSVFGTGDAGRGRNRAARFFFRSGRKRKRVRQSRVDRWGLRSDPDQLGSDGDNRGTGNDRHFSRGTTMIPFMTYYYRPVSSVQSPCENGPESDYEIEFTLLRGKSPDGTHVAGWPVMVFAWVWHGDDLDAIDVPHGCN